MLLMLIKVHLLGVVIAIVLQGLVQIVSNFKMRPLNRYANCLKDLSKTHQLEITPHSIRSIPLQSEVALAQPNPLNMLDWKLFFETALHSLLLGWINVLLTGIALTAVLALTLPKEYLASLNRRIDDLKSGSSNRFDFNSDLLGLYLESGAIYPNQEYQFRELLRLHEAFLSKQSSGTLTQSEAG